MKREKVHYTPNPFFGANLLSLRTAKGWSQEQIAGLLGIGRSRYCNWENGYVEPCLEHFYSIAKLYKITMEQLLKEPLPNKILIEVKYPKMPKNEEATAEAL